MTKKSVPSKTNKNKKRFHISIHVLIVATFAAIIAGAWLTYAGVSAQAASSVFTIVDAQKYGFNYAYAPSIIKENGVFHTFFCSIGGPGAWDFIRYTKSSDGGKTWSKPSIKIQAQFNGISNVAACDPSLVYYKGYYYLYYSSAYRVVKGATDSEDVWLTSIQVARATTIAGTYKTYTQRNTWESNPKDPKILIKPFVEKQTAGYYGAGQQTVLVKDNKIKMWYSDDTYYNDGLHTFYTESSDPVVWFTDSQKQINLLGAHSVDIKYDLTRNTYVMARIVDAHNSGSYLALWQSPDGINWSPLKTVSPANEFPDYAHNVGISSDKIGNLLLGKNLIGFGAAPGLISDISWGKWNLYGLFDDPFTSNL